MNSPDVNLDVCESILRENLEGYRGFPPTAAGVRRFAFALQENCVSVGHVRAVLKSFEELFPTVRQIHDVAFGLRPQFEPQKDTVAEWERKYGKAQSFQKYPADEMAMHWQAFRDMLYYTEGPGAQELESGRYFKSKEDSRNYAKDIEFWQAARARDFDPKWNHMDSITFVRQMVEKYTWVVIMEMDSAPETMPYTRPDHRTRFFKQAASPITQADIAKAEQAHRKTTEEVDREMDSSGPEGWDDPDR